MSKNRNCRNCRHRLKCKSSDYVDPDTRHLATIERLRTGMADQIRRWELAASILNAVDDAKGQERFMDVHDPIGLAKKAIEQDDVS